MTSEQLDALLNAKERTHVEFKEARNELPRNLFETVGAFLNREGGVILLGVKNDGTVLGVDPVAADKLMADIVTLSNNPQKLDPPFILSPRIIHYRSAVVILVQVPANSQVHRSKGLVYDRSHDGDFRVTDPERIAEIVNRKRYYYTELTVYPFLSFSQFRSDLFQKARRLMQIQSPQHSWLALSDEEMLLKAGFWRNDPLTSRQGYTLAAGLMFGNDETIQQLVPHYKIDALVRRRNLDRYDDRLVIRTNLIDAHDELMSFLAKHLSDPFFMEDNQRVSLRDKIFREVVANLIVHREYTDAHPATMIIYGDRVETTNAARPHGSGPILPGSFTPFPKNPVLSKFYLQIGRVEELGSGVLNVNKYLPHYVPGGTPQFLEGNPFITIIPLPPETSAKTGRKTTHKTGVETRVKKRPVTRVETRVKILSLLRENPAMSAPELAAATGLTVKGVEWNLSRLKTAGLLRHVGPRKGGHWELL